MERAILHRALYRRRAGFAIVSALLVIAIARAAAIGEAGVDLVRLDGIVGASNAPGSIIQCTLVIGQRRVPFSVLAAQRYSGIPLEGPGVLLGMGTDEPVILLQGSDSELAPITAAAQGTHVAITGNLSVSMRSLTVMSVELPPTPSPSSASPPQ